MQVAKDGLSLVAVLRQIVLEPLLIALHSALFSRPTRVGLVVFGKGNIGGHWLGLYAREKARLEHELNLALTLYGVFDSKGGLLDEEGWIPQGTGQLQSQAAYLAGAALPAGAAQF